MIFRALTEDDVPSIRTLGDLARAEGFRFVDRFLEDLVCGRVELPGQGTLPT